jgi:AcrR family transcriptional regulator
MDEIVQEAGLSKGGLYGHFASKKELFLAIIESELGLAQTEMQASVVSKTSAREKLDALLASFAVMATSDQVLEIAPLTLDVWARNGQDPEVHQVAIAVYNRFRDSVVQVIEEGIVQGEFKAVDATAMGSILVALYDGLMVQVMLDQGLVDWRAISETMRKTLVAGLRSAEGGDD